MTASIPHSPADELRQAAAKVRETAAKATPGPWADASTDDDSIRPRWILGQPTDPDDPWSATEPIVVTEEHLEYGEVVTREDVAWIALMSPALAEPLAASLEGQGKRFNNEMGLDAPECPSCDTVPAHNHPVDFFHDGDQNRAGCEQPFAGPEGDRCTCFDDALAVARVINGGAS